MEKQIANGVVQEIHQLHDEIVTALKTSLEKGIRIGELLAEVKARLNHGEFLPWLKENLPFTDRTARRYMMLYRNREKLKTDTVSDLTGAYRLLEAPQKKDSLLDLTPEELKQMIQDINNIIDDIEYSVSLGNGIWSKHNDGSFTEIEAISADLAYNIYTHLCYFRQHIFFKGTDSLPPGLIDIIGNFDTNERPKKLCGNHCQWDKKGDAHGHRN